jgi:hypothetical protein
MPVALESVANVRIAGESTFRMRYDYESVNGQRVGAPEARASTATVTAGAGARPLRP